MSENRVGVESGVRRAQTNPAALASPAAEVDDPQDAPRDSRPLALNLRLNSLTGPVTLASIQVSLWSVFRNALTPRLFSKAKEVIIIWFSRVSLLIIMEISC